MPNTLTNAAVDSGDSLETSTRVSDALRREKGHRLGVDIEKLRSVSIRIIVYCVSSHTSAINDFKCS